MADQDLPPFSDEKNRARLTGKGEAGGSCGAPTCETHPDGQLKDHWVLPAEERAKGFVRPVRRSYRHVGLPAPANPLRDLDPEELECYEGTGFVKFEPYPQEPAALVCKIGRYWTQAELDKVGKGCGVVTSMPQAIAETYARSPRYYGQTFCCGCGTYLPVGEHGEFVWDGTNERVGT